MRKNKISIVDCLLMLLIFLIVSCRNNENISPSLNIIPIEGTIGNYNVLNFSDFATDIMYIPLETNDSVLLSPQLFQVIYENEITLILYATPSGIDNCYMFDNEGKFLCQIGQRGQGPNDYLQINNVVIHEKLIYLMAWHKILIYDMTGHLIENINLQSNIIPEEYRDSSVRRIVPLSKDEFVVTVVDNSRGYPTAFLFETEKHTVKTIKKYPGSIKIDRLGSAYNGNEIGNMYRYKDEVRIYKPINDTIFTIDQNTEIKKSFIFEFGKYGLPLSFYERKEDGGGDVFQMIENTRNFINKYISINLIYESNNHLFFKFRFGNHTPEPIEEISFFGDKYISSIVYGVFNKNTGEMTLMKQPIKGKLGFKNDIDNGPVIFPHYISSNNELVTYISVEEFLDYYNKIENPTPQMTEVAKNIDLDDNQIVIVAKLK